MRARRVWIALLLVTSAACVAPRQDYPPENERDAAEVREEKRMSAMGAALQAVANHW